MILNIRLLAIIRFDQDTVTNLHALFSPDNFEGVSVYCKTRYGTQRSYGAVEAKYYTISLVTIRQSNDRLAQLRSKN